MNPETGPLNPTPPRGDSASEFTTVEKLREEQFLVTIICPCGSRASISAKKMTLGELIFIGDWAKSHQAHGKEAEH